MLRLPGLLAQLELVMIEEDMYIRNGTAAVEGEQLVTTACGTGGCSGRASCRHGDRTTPTTRAGMAGRDTCTTVPNVATAAARRRAFDSASQLVYDVQAKETHRLPTRLLSCAPLHEGPWDSTNVREGLHYGPEYYVVRDER